MSRDQVTPDLFAAPAPQRVPPARARRTDPQTAHVAAERLEDSSRQEAISAWLRRRGRTGGTTLECAKALRIDRSNLSSTFTRLERAQVITRKRTGTTDDGRPVYESRCSPGSARESNVWWANP